MHASRNFQQHFEWRVTQARQHMSTLGYDALIIDAGISQNYFEDDYPPPFHANPQFLAYCPISGEGSVILIHAEEEKPTLYWYQPSDFWHDYEALPLDILNPAFQIRLLNTQQQLWDAIKVGSRSAYLGERVHVAKERGWKPNPDTLWSALRFDRAQKSAFEISCIERANRVASRGHLAVKKLFCQQEQISEFELYMHYLQATQELEQDLPYGAIIGLNQNASVLHYRSKNKASLPANTLLIDAGAKVNHYASDITRTYAKPHCPETFQALLGAVETLQQSLCTMVQTGVTYSDIEYKYKIESGRILLEAGLIQGMSAEEALDKGLTAIFAPHSIGHMLGIQTHDVGGQQMDKWGTPCKMDPRFPNLRAMRTLRTNEVVTIEPGIYFIPLLKRKAEELDLLKYIDTKLFDTLVPFGGIRIEDNVIAQEQAHSNITRKYLE